MKKKTKTHAEDPYRLSLEEMPEAAAILAPGGEIARANKALSRLLGKSPARITGVRFGDFVNADHRKSFEATLKSRRASGSKTEVVLDGRGGESIPVLVSSRPVSMEDGTRTFLVVTDLRETKGWRTERRDAERAALAERLRLFEVLETLPAYVVLLSPDYHVPFANKFFRDRFGDSRGRRCFEYLFERTEPCDDCESYTAMRTGKRHHWEWTGPDGRTYDIHDFPFRDWDGSPLIMEMGIDITEQKRAEESQRQASQYARSLIEASLDPLVTISSDGKITDVNEATVKATGVPRHKLIGTDFSGYFTEPEKARSGYRRVFAKGSVTDYPLTLRRKDAESMDVLYNATVYKDGSGRVLGVFAAARDVTERKRAEEELKRHRDHLEELVRERTEELEETTARLQVTVDSLTEGLVVSDLNGNLLQWNPVAIAMHGLESSEDGRRPLPEFTEIFELSTEEDGILPVEQWPLARILRGETLSNYEVCVRRLKSDWKRVFNYGGTLARDRDGEPLLAVVTLSDITERKVAEESLKLERSRLAAIIENTPVGIAVTDENGGTIHSNSAFENIWGKSRPTTRGVSDYAKYKAWWAGTEEPVLPEEWASAVVVRTGKPCLDQILRIRRFDGTEAFIQNSAAPVLGNGGEMVGSVVAILDISERMRAEEALRESERRWRDLANAMPQMVWTCDPAGRCDFLSRRWIEDTGRPEADMLGLGWLDSIHPDDRERLMTGWNGALRAGGGFEGEFRIRQRDGEYRWYKTGAVAIRDDRGTVIKWYGSNTDIEDIKRTEHRLSETNGRLELLAAVTGRLLASDDPQKIIVDLASMTMELLDCHMFFNFLADEETRRLRLNAYAGVPKEDARRIEWLDYGEAVCGCVARDGCRIVEERIQRGSDSRTALVRSFGIQAYACHPLLSGDRVLGTLSFGSRSRERFSEEDVGLMQTVSDHIAIAISRLRAEEALREKEKDLNRAQAVARVGSWRLNAQRNELVWSDENHRILGIPKGTPLTYERFLSTVHPDDRGYVDEKWKAALRGERYDIEHRIVVNGEVRWVRDRAEIEFASNGELLGGFGTTQDITGRKKNEEEIERSRLWLERVAGTTPDVIFVLDIVKSRYVYANRRLLEMLGYSPEEMQEADDVLEKAIEAEDLAGAAEFYRNMAGAKPGEIRVLTHRALHRDGRTRWLENRVTPFSWDENGELKEVIGISHDITDLKMAQEVLQRDRETFERLVNERTAELIEIHHELDKAKHLSDIGMLASTVAHELRNPLGVIKTAAYNINRKKQGDALDKHLQTINKKIDESNQIINNLLIYARVKPPAYETVRIGDLLHESLESAKVRNEGRPVIFRDECGPVQNVVATLDPYQIAEVMSNILTNAAQAIPVESGGSVTVSARVADGMLHIRISDTGAGIDPDVLPRVFEPFFTSKSKGTGLGLSLCRELVVLHNGSIDIESEPGKGTSVTVILPLSPGIRPAIS